MDERGRDKSSSALPGISRGILGRLLPTPGNVAFTLVVVCGLFVAHLVPQSAVSSTAVAGHLVSTMSSATSAQTIVYQGRLSNANGITVPDGAYPMTFKLYDSNGSLLWSEQLTDVPVSNGIFDAVLGAMSTDLPSVISSHASLWLGITVGSDPEMSPRIQLASVPYAIQAQSAAQAQNAVLAQTVPNGSITTAQIAGGAVSTGQLADAAVTSRKVKPTTVTLHPPPSTCLPLLYQTWQIIPGLTYTFTPEVTSTVLVWLVTDFSGAPNAQAGDQAYSGVFYSNGGPPIAVADTPFTFESTNVRSASSGVYSFSATGGQTYTVTGQAINNSGSRGYACDTSSMLVLVVSQ